MGGLPEASDAACSEGIDNDGNGYIDCDDRTCTYTTSVTLCGEEASAESSPGACIDGRDNDGDGYVDCQDYDCFWNGDIGTCDRDDDGFTPNQGDCLDHPDVTLSTVASPQVPELCGDGQDNDCDGSVEESECLQLELGARRVAYVIDGDTVEISTLGRARLVGIDTPESYEDSPDGIECFGLEAKAFTESSLDGETVLVSLDPFGWETGFQDIYGRYLVHLETLDGTYFNDALVMGGFACVWEDVFRCVKTESLVESQDAAQASGAGLWGACQPNPASVCF